MSLFSCFRRKKTARILQGPALAAPAPGAGISIVVPYANGAKTNARALNWQWLRRYYEAQLPGAEIVLGTDRYLPFSKSAAVNQGASAARSSILLILDCDAFLEAAVIVDCAERIREAQRFGNKLWFIPYRAFHRMTEEGTRFLLTLDPRTVSQLPIPSDGSSILASTFEAKRGDWYGAAAQMMSRAAWDDVGGWDKRFRGWGGEDSAAMLAMDTLYAKHKSTANALYHLWHPMLSPTGATSEMVPWDKRMWDGQSRPAAQNFVLAGRYRRAYGDPQAMRQLLRESRDPVALRRAAAGAHVGPTPPIPKPGPNPPLSL